MSQLAAALSWAQRGFRVFPLKEYSKEPALDNFPKLATTDVDTIRRMWTDPVLNTEKAYNIGCLCNDMVVIDIDVKKGKDGLNEYANIGGTFDTLVVQTPTGGYHCYFNGPDSGNASISGSVDVRSHNGFVVAPGSYIPGTGTEWYVVANEAPIKWIPSTIEVHLKDPYKREGRAGDFELDSQAAIQAAINYLITAPPAIEGRSGDETTFKVAARLQKELGIGYETACVLMRDYYNPRCQPPWELDDLYTKVDNASRYATAAEGRISSEFLFGHITPHLTPPPSIFEQVGLAFGNAVEPMAIPPRPWLMPGVLMKQNVTLMLAAGSAGKSSISLALAGHLALGKEFMNSKPDRGYKTIVYNAEDDVHEQSRRLLAMCNKNLLDYKSVSSSIMLLSQAEIKLDLVNEEFRKAYRNEEVVRQLIEYAKSDDVGLLVLDPLVKIHKVDESDNPKMDFVMETLQYIAREANVSVLALHHVSKMNNRAGDVDMARGASAITNAARVAFTLVGPTEDDAERYGFRDEDRNKWVRLDDAKMNLTLARSHPIWFKKEAVRIQSGDTVGVLKQEDVSLSHERIEDRVAKAIISGMRDDNSAKMAVNKAVALMKSEENYWANKGQIEIKALLEKMLTKGHRIGDTTVTFVRDYIEKTGKEEVYISII